MCERQAGSNPSKCREGQAAWESVWVHVSTVSEPQKPRLSAISTAPPPPPPPPPPSPTTTAINVPLRSLSSGMPPHCHLRCHRPPTLHQNSCGRARTSRATTQHLNFTLQIILFLCKVVLYRVSYYHILFNINSLFYYIFNFQTLHLYICISRI